jgi:hypothetical protein
MLSEEWRPVPGWEAIYEASSRGRIRSVGRTVMRGGHRMRVATRILRPNVHHSGYLRVVFSHDGLRSERLVHWVIALAFHGPRPEGMEVRHLNGNRADNRPANLRYGTSRENSLDTVAHGNNLQAKRTHCPQGHELAGPNLVSSEKARGHRKCRACSSAHAYVWRHQTRDQFPAIADHYYQQYTGRIAVEWG